MFVEISTKPPNVIRKKTTITCPSKAKKAIKIFGACKTKVFDSVCIVGFCWISKLPIWRSHDFPFWKGILRIDTLREDIMAMEHPRFPFHRKYVFECFMLIDHKEYAYSCPIASNMVLQVCKQLVGGFNTRFPAPLPICTSVLVVCAGCKVSETHLLDQKPTKQTQGVLRLERFMLNRKNIWVISAR